MIEGKGISASHYFQWQHVWFSYQRIGKASVSEVLFIFFGRSIFPELGGGGEVSVSLRSAEAVLVCRSADR